MVAAEKGCRDSRTGGRGHPGATVSGDSERPTAASASRSHRRAAHLQLFRCRLSVTAIQGKQRISHNRCYKTCAECMFYDRQAVWRRRVGRRAPGAAAAAALSRLPSLCAASAPLPQNTGNADGQHGGQDSKGRALGPSPRLGPTRTRCDLLRHFRRKRSPSTLSLSRSPLAPS